MGVQRTWVLVCLLHDCRQTAQPLLVSCILRHEGGGDGSPHRWAPSDMKRPCRSPGNPALSVTSSVSPGLTLPRHVAMCTDAQHVRACGTGEGRGLFSALGDPGTLPPGCSERLGLLLGADWMACCLGQKAFPSLASSQEVGQLPLHLFTAHLWATPWSLGVCAVFNH